ncbi:hypothetical protein INT47_000323 [Mucor saturninus]|uniref:Uncharacterized protein n=1 Tax=Mucor saturninus TaxID=64648 RepID=A0A8H7UVN4_9FUNG|nr:hypothetical protein INT47_000323 [Mucor saturninus]
MRPTGIPEIMTAVPRTAAAPAISTPFEPALNNNAAGRATLSVNQRLSNLERNAAVTAAAVAAAAAAPPPIKLNYILQTLIRDSYKDYVAIEKLPGWLLNYSTLSKENIVMHDYLLETVRKHDNRVANLHENTPFLSARRKFVKAKVRSHYMHLRDVENQKSWDAGRIRAAALANRQKSRMQTKMRRRRGNFAKYKLAFEAKYGEDCGTFVDRAYMSEEDEDILDEHGNALTFLNRVPIWRTDKLQAFVHELDKPSMKLKPSANKLCIRTAKPAEDTTVSLDILATLPRWGVETSVFL